MRSLWVLIGLVSILLFSRSVDGAVATPTAMYAHFISVGQADATLLEFAGAAVLIDAGGQDQERVSILISYLQRFFQARPHLNNTLSTLFITHAHVDHTRGLKEVIEAFTVKNLVHTGLLSGFAPADTDIKWVTSNAVARGIQVFDLDTSDITAVSPAGFSNAQVDPISGPGVDPEIHLFSADHPENPGWPSEDFKDENNHSLVIRIRFGESSFLFTGDLEEPAIETMLEHYQGSQALDVDVYHVGHHGSHNGTTLSLLEAITPEIAIISMGSSSEHVQWSAWAYGHPRNDTVTKLMSSITRTRNPAKHVPVASGVKRFKNVLMRDAIYGTGWDGNIVIRADVFGRFRVFTGQ